MLFRCWISATCWNRWTHGYTVVLGTSKLCCFAHGRFKPKSYPFIAGVPFPYRREAELVQEFRLDQPGRVAEGRGFVVRTEPALHHTALPLCRCRLHGHLPGCMG